MHPYFTGCSGKCISGDRKLNQIEDILASHKDAIRFDWSYSFLKQYIFQINYYLTQQNKLSKKILTKESDKFHSTSSLHHLHQSTAGLVPWNYIKLHPYTPSQPITIHIEFQFHIYSSSIKPWLTAGWVWSLTLSADPDSGHWQMHSPSLLS